jgi:hypothetical protein
LVNFDLYANYRMDIGFKLLLCRNIVIVSLLAAARVRGLYQCKV